ncbi:shikimate kinase [Qipengyuania sp. DGS5-3]|uniref:shikimate kinase n=1 Tax=Qipengyuania sp. DGS5-3 TaxID=3349632 RepID=UPI0036D305D8
MSGIEELDEDRLGALARKLDRPLVLIGLMGTGKSTIGRRIAGMLGLDFVDADDEIVHASQRSISEIFDEFGEDYFREGERRVIARLMTENKGVIATGGGAFVNDETRALILEQGIAIWLDCDIDTLVERTSRRNTRPLLKQGDPREILTRLKEERSGAYSKAQVHVVTGDLPHHETAMQVLEALEKWL